LPRRARLRGDDGVNGTVNTTRRCRRGGIDATRWCRISDRSGEDDEKGIRSGCVPAP